jgi:hypothetical protein
MMAQVLVVLEEKIAVAHFGVKTTCLSCISKTSEVVENYLEEPLQVYLLITFVYLNYLAIVCSVICVTPHYPGKC